MENLAPISIANDIPTKAYVDSKAASAGFKGYSGRWGPAWSSSKASLISSIPSYWIYAYRLTSQVSIQTVAAEVAAAAAGGTFKLALYSDANPWPGTLSTSVALTTDAIGIKSAAMSIAAGSFWLAIHNTSTIALPMRAVVELNPYTPGSIDASGVMAMASGICYNVGSATTPATWPAGTGTDATGLELLLRAA